MISIRRIQKNGIDYSSYDLWMGLASVFLFETKTWISQLNKQTKVQSIDNKFV